MKNLFLIFTILVGPLQTWAYTNTCAAVFREGSQNGRLKIEDLSSKQLLEIKLWDSLSHEIKTEVNLNPLKVKIGSAVWTGSKEFLHLKTLPQKDIAERFSAESFKYHEKNERLVIDVALWTYINLMQDMGAGKAKRSFSVLKDLTNDARGQLDRYPSDLKATRQNFQMIADALTYLLGRDKFSLPSEYESSVSEANVRSDILKLLKFYYEISVADAEQINSILKKHSLLAQQQGIEMLVDSNKISLKSAISMIEQALKVIDTNPASELKLILELSLEKTELAVN